MTITAIQKLTQAEKWLTEAKSLDELKEIHDIAIAADAYAKAHKLGIEVENHAIEIRLLAARRMGELVPAIPPEKRGEIGGRGREKKMSENRTSIEIPKQRLSEFRKLAEIPLPEFKEKIEIIKGRGEKINYNRLIYDSWKPVLYSKDFEWWTPEKYCDAAHEVMGGIDLDPASCEEANKTVRAKKYYDIQDNGLLKMWKGRIFLNPPYGRTAMEFIEKFFNDFESTFNEGIILVNSNATETDWFQPLFEGIICFVDHRISFIFPEIEKSTPTHGNSFVYFGLNREKFAEIFAEFGNIVKRWPDV